MKYGGVESQLEAGPLSAQHRLDISELVIGGIFLHNSDGTEAQLPPLIYVVILLQHPNIEISRQASCGFIGVLSDTLLPKSPFLP